MSDLYFDIPTQVRFFCPTEEDKPAWENGIAYRNEVICGCCGAIFTFEDIFNDARDYGIPEEQAVQIWEMWVNFSDYIGEF